MAQTLPLCRLVAATIQPCAPASFPAAAFSVVDPHSRPLSLAPPASFCSGGFRRRYFFISISLGSSISPDSITSTSGHLATIFRWQVERTRHIGDDAARFDLGDIALEADGQIDIAAGADVDVTGTSISHTANVAFKAEGAASAELSAAGQTTVKGAMVMIN